jgi:hypothetical protein
MIIINGYRPRDPGKVWITQHILSSFKNFLLQYQIAGENHETTPSGIPDAKGYNPEASIHQEHDK